VPIDDKAASGVDAIIFVNDQAGAARKVPVNERVFAASSVFNLARLGTIENLQQL